MFRCGELDPHTCTIEVATGKKGVFEKQDFQIYKVNNIYRAKEEVIRKHREFLRAKYSGKIPYRDEHHKPLGSEDLDEESLEL